MQVKSTEMWLGTCYLCQLHAFGQQPYTSKEIDYFAIYVFPEDVWYIFPVKRLAGMRTIALTPHLNGHKYEPFMENWWLLARPHPCRKEKTFVPNEDARLNSMNRLTQRILKRLDALGH